MNIVNLLRVSQHNPIRFVKHCSYKIVFCKEFVFLLCVYFLVRLLGFPSFILLKLPNLLFISVKCE